MGGKTGTTTSSVAIPPEVLARYNDVNKQAQTTAGTPFQQYSTDPSAFVAPLNTEQQAATAQTNQYANAAQPAYGAAMQGTSQAYQGYNAPNYQSGVAGYMNPFVNQAMGSTAAYLQNQNQQQQQQLLGQGISAGAFGGDRGKVAQAALMGQQNLAMGNTLSNMANTGYQQSAQNYLAGLGQQGALSAQMGALGVQGQQAGLQGAQAMMGAGTLGQQTSQAGQTALYNQFQQQQAYPFQVSQFLANIAEGTGALSGSTTTTQAPQSFFSDVRLKEDIKRVGTAKNGLPIYTFKYKGDDTEQTHTGYMAQDVEKVHPEAVGESHGYKTVDYDKASEPVHRAFGGLNLNPAANLMTGGGDQTSQDPEWLKNHPAPEGHGGDNKGPAGFVTNHDYSPSSGYGGGVAGALGNIGSAVGGMFGGITGDSGVGGTEGQGMYARGGSTNSEGGVVAPEHSREGYFDGGDVINPNDLSALLAQQQQMYSPFEKGGLYGGSAAGTPSGKGVVPAANLHVSHLAVANPARTQQGDTLMGDVQQVEDIGDRIKKANDYRKDIIGHPAVPAQAAVPANAQTGAAAQPAVAAQDATGYEWLKQYLPQGQAHGGVVGYASGGGVEPYQTDDPMSQVVSDTEKDKNKHGLMTAQNPTGQPSSTLGDLGKIASLAAVPGEIASGAGAAASGIGSLMAMLAPIGLASGGVVPREHHANPNDTNGQSNVVGNGDQTPNYEALAQATAQKYGLNPKDFGSVIKGESGFNPKAIGDEGSSAGLGQFHIAGASEKYPHAGLGDDYISARNPELAKSGTAQDKIAYLSDPANAPDQLDFMGQHVAKNGYGAWTAAKNLGLADLPAKNAVPAQAVVNGQQGFQTPDSETPKKSLGDTLMSEQFLVPLLSGLGTMAGSNSRYLGAAILQGIGGGAKAYEDVQNNLMQRQLDQPIAQSRNIAVANQLQSGLVEYNATRSAAGLPPVSLQEYARISGYKGALPEGVQDTSSNQPSGQGFNYSIPEMNSLNINRNGVNIPAMNDQGYLRTFIAKNAGIQSPYMKSAVESAQHNLDQIVANQRTQNAAGETINAPGAIGTGQQTALASQRMASSGEFVNQAIAFNKIAPNIKQNLSDLEDIYSQFRSGASGPARQSFQQLMGAIDPQGNYPSLHDADASNYQSALKGAASLMTAQLANMPAGAPKSELEALQRQIANPNMEPAAVHHIISRAKAAVDYQDKMNMGYNPEENNYDVLGYQRKFKSTPENDYEKLVNTTEENMKPGAGTSGTITPETGKIYQDANGNKARWDGSKYIKVQ
jgi:hypothetical protein